MKSRIIYERYGKYHEETQRLGSYPILKVPTIDELVVNKSMVQSLYKEMKQIDFKGSLIDFVCYVSLGLIIENIKKEADENISYSMLDWGEKIICKYKNYAPDVRNILKLYNSNPFFFAMLRCEIKGVEFTDEEFDQDKKTDFDNFVDSLKCNFLLAGFMELLIYEDRHGQKREDHIDVYDTIKKFLRH